MKTKTIFLTLVLFIGATAMCVAQSYPEMIPVEGGTFTMGDTEMEGDANEQPTHQVTLKAFSIAKTETTVAQWRTFCNATGRQLPKPPPFWEWIDSNPIVNINWQDAVGYCEWLSDKTGELYRLPTEAEWEYAARGGNKSKGFKYSGAQSMDAVGWFIPNSNNQTQPVCLKRPNELGIYDMSGNVWEWCKDWFGPYTAEAQTNPRGPATGSLRVMRGGSWNDVITTCRVSLRSRFGPSDLIGSIGFRVVLSR